jgi:hypothetical protein
MIAAIVSALHVLALALGLPSVYFRGRALKGSLDYRHGYCEADEDQEADGDRRRSRTAIEPAP